MLPELSEIPTMRRNLMLTQQSLSALSGISQSDISKIEAGKSDPSYNTVKRLFEALTRAQNMGERNARQIMNPHIISLRKDETAYAAIRLMKERGISQLPILDAHGKIVGSLSEKTILSIMEERPSFKSKATKIALIMDEPFPTVGEKTPASTLTHILRDSPAVLVLKGTKIIGIISKTDLFKTI